MLMLLSPSKKLDHETPLPAALRRRATEPVFVDRAAELMTTLAALRPAEVARLMHLSDELAALNVARYQLWTPQATAADSRPAIRAFAGDVYQGLDAATLGTADLDWAQKHVAILSGLYGVLRPFDRLQPYRLEMGTALPTARGRDLYAYWGDTIAAWLDAELQRQRRPVLVNLASAEYFRAVQRPALKARVVHCHFEDWSRGAWRVLGLFAKRARGMMARHAIVNRIDDPAKLVSFDADGYAHDAAASSSDRLVFRRRAG